MTTRALDDGTGRLTATLRLEDLALVRAALDEAAASARAAGDERTGGQVRAASAAAKATLRRLFVTRDQRALVGMESTGRVFDGLLGEFLDLRDGGTCRTPGCNAPLRHRDHISPATQGGPTQAENGQGLCERCNYVKETPGWATWVADRPPEARHEVHGVTEHLRIIRSTSPPMPGGPAGTRDYSPAELELANHYTLAC